VPTCTYHDTLSYLRYYMFQPSGTPATAVDGTMYRRKSCYKVSLPENLAGSRGVRETTRSYANVQRARSKSSCDHHRTSTIDR